MITPTSEPGSNITGGGPSFTVVVHINSIPSGAEIWIDNINTERLTNDTVSFEFGGSFTLKLILSGYETYEMNYEVSDIPITVPLVPIVTTTTTPTVTTTTTPTVTPTTTPTVTPTTTPTVTPTTTPTVTPTTTPTVTPTTTPTVTPTTMQLPFQIRSNPDGAQIWIDGEFTGKLTPDIIYFDSSGSYTYELRLNGYQPYQQSVYISDSITKEVTLIPLQTTNPSILSKIIEFIRSVFAFQS